ncbi:MAG TPA: membrane protein insertion efficiency factor YidD [Verrucomicrobiae bacterium]|nr:membrane protein insertion efficiency factor YidD [Verrucomicrobiae bacterium]
MTNFQIPMTKEFPTANDQISARAAVSNSLFGLRDSLVILVSSSAIQVLVFIIRLYRWTLSPVLAFLLGPAGGCRFTPSCSQYAVDAVRSRGALAGGWQAVKRVCRCHPWGGCGHDPVPEKEHRISNSEFRI